MQSNLKAKYGITDEQLRAAKDALAKNIKKISDINLMFAMCDLLNNGDVAPENEEKD